MQSLAEMLDLRGLDPEPWGARLVRARERAGLRTREVVGALDEWMTKGALYALEHLASEPAKRQDRRRALLLLVFYGTDPSEFGLAAEDTPAGLDLRYYRQLGERYRSERAGGADWATALRIARSACIPLEDAA